jgi:DNA-binding Lrp family transcriptional regulator
MITKIDKKLISLLVEDGRSSYREIARSLGISTSTVTRKVNDMEKAGLLTIKAIPNPFKINHTSAAVIGMNISVEKIDDVCSRLKNIFNINSIVKTFGRYNLFLAVYFPSWSKLHNFISSGLLSPGENSHTDIFFVKKIIKPFNQKLNGSENASPGEIDDLDIKIIEFLSKNGRYSGVYLADKLGISVSAVSKRLSRLFKEDVVNIRAQINPVKLGYHANALIFLRVAPDKREEVCRKLNSYHELNTILSLVNGYDILINATAKNAGALYEFIKNKMTPAYHILDMETLICGDYIKRYHNIFNIDEMLNDI